ncbi:hypothetical protein GCM10028798_03090 [Humibacter antri]
MTIAESPLHEAKAHQTVTITMNSRYRVVLDGAKQTGLEIKNIAIAQGVPIKPDFLLSHKVGKKYKPVADNEQVHVKDDDEFLAVDGDDNS